MDLLIRILHLEGKPTDHTGNRTPEFCPRKILANTRALPMQEGNLCEICRRTAIVIRYLITILIRVNPPLRVELFPILSPK